MGSSSNNAQREASAAEAQRRREIEAAQRQIESVYSAPGREADIQDLVAATRQFLGNDLNEQNADARRQLKFALARDGQSMGSVAVDRNKDLGQAYLKAALEVERRSQSAGNALRSADQQSKLNLFSMAQQGMDIGTAARQAGEMMRSNLANAKADSMESGVANAFGQFGEVLKRSRERAGERKAERYQYGTFYAPMAGGGGIFG